VEPSAALADLTEISSQIEAAVLFDASGEVKASTVDDERARWLVQPARELLDEAARVRSSGGDVTQLELATPEGSVFLVRDGDRLILATTGPEPTVGLVFYDLKTCLRNADEQAAKKPTRRRTKKEDGAET
jgi:predicted regulator of Ras-like GTPase activity (Roadblock/LC7/MglB family)